MARGTKRGGGHGVSQIDGGVTWILAASEFAGRFSHCIAACSRYHRAMSLDDDVLIEGRSPHPIRFPGHDWRLARNQLEAKRRCLTEHWSPLQWLVE